MRISAGYSLIERVELEQRTLCKFSLSNLRFPKCTSNGKSEKSKVRNIDAFLMQEL